MQLLFLRKKIVATGVALIALGSLIFFNDAPFVRRVQDVVVGALRPFMRGGMAVRRAVFSWGSWISEEEVLRLHEENAGLRAQVVDHGALQERVARLESALRFEERNRVVLRGARIALFHKAFGKEYFMVDNDDAGKRVGEGTFAVDSNGTLVGIVREVGKGLLKISLASNRDETFEGELMPLGIKVLVKGMGARTFSIELIPAGAPVRRGDFVVSATGDLSRRALVAEVVSVVDQGVSTFRDVRAILVAQPELLQEVFLVVPRDGQKSNE